MSGDRALAVEVVNACYDDLDEWTENPDTAKRNAHIDALSAWRFLTSRTFHSPYRSAVFDALGFTAEEVKRGTYQRYGRVFR